MVDRIREMFAEEIAESRVRRTRRSSNSKMIDVTPGRARNTDKQISALQRMLYEIADELEDLKGDL